MNEKKSVRKGISKKTRIEVFKRDGFQCQYCGRSAPDVVLHIDHINPVKHGGDNNLINLVTACIDCNQGKAGTPLADQTIAKKQMRQLQELSERREQLKMIADWRAELRSLDDETLANYEAEIKLRLKCGLSDYGKKGALKTIKKYGYPSVLEALDKSYSQYYSGQESSIDKVLNYVEKICYWQKIEKSDPRGSDIAWICSLADKYWVRSHKRTDVYKLARNYFDAGVSKEHLIEVLKSVRSIRDFEDKINGELYE